MISALVLTMPNFQLPFEIETGACGSGIGAVLMQRGKLIAYFSQQLSEKGKNGFVCEKELITIELAMK